MKYFFISGIPASGKSYLAKKVAKELEILHVGMDDLREDMSSDIELSKWVNFFRDQDEKEYWEKTDCEQHWLNIKKQAEAFWPSYQKKINEIVSSDVPAIFEGVSILPHLAAKHLNFKGIYLINNSVEEVFDRIKVEPRCGKTKNLQKIEAEAFVKCDGVMYKKEAESYRYKVFTDTEKVEKEIYKYFRS